jgi:hypothetical protein
MTFLITYHPPTRANAILPSIFQSSDSLHTEWITPDGWSAHDAKQDFEARHPGAVVLRCEAISLCEQLS